MHIYTAQIRYVKIKKKSIFDPGILQMMGEVALVKSFGIETP